MLPALEGPIGNHENRLLKSLAITGLCGEGCREWQYSISLHMLMADDAMGYDLIHCAVRDVDLSGPSRPWCYRLLRRETSRMALHKNRPAIGIKSNVALPQLDRDLTRSRRRAGRLWRSYQRIDEKRDPAGSAATHLEWSDAVEMTLKIVDAISREQAHDLGELRVQFDAIWWWIVEDDSLLDASARRWLRGFRRSLHQLVTQK